MAPHGSYPNGSFGSFVCLVCGVNPLQNMQTEWNIGLENSNGTELFVLKISGRLPTKELDFLPDQQSSNIYFFRGKPNRNPISLKYSLVISLVPPDFYGIDSKRRTVPGPGA